MDLAGAPFSSPQNHRNNVEWKPWNILRRYKNETAPLKFVQLSKERVVTKRVALGEPYILVPQLSEVSNFNLHRDWSSACAGPAICPLAQ
jgi:hypothetical protein